MDAAAESPRSPEAAIGARVEDLWEVLEPQLSPTEKLNSCFQDIPVDSFPIADGATQVVEIPSDASLTETVEILSKNKILSAPVRNVNSPEDAGWMERYIGIVEFVGISMWLLQQYESNGKAGGGEGTPQGSPVARLNSFSFRRTKSGDHGTDLASEDAGGRDASSKEDASVGGSFFKALTSSEFYKNTKVDEIAGTFRWAPFLAVPSSDNFLTTLLLLSKYRMRSVPVIDLQTGRIGNVVTQSAVVHMLAECAGLPWFESWGGKKLSELGLPIMAPYRLLKIRAHEPVLRAFQLMQEKGIGGLPVVDASGKKPIGNISIRDVQYLLTSSEIYKEYRTITAEDFLTVVRRRRQEHDAASPLLGQPVVTCSRDETIKDIILRLDSIKIHRIYVVDSEGDVEGVITLRDIISKLVHEPRDYFGDFFDGVIPLPANSTV